MAVSAFVWPNVDQASITKTFNLGAAQDSLYVMLYATGTFTWSAGSFTPRTYTTVSQFTAGDGTNGALVEVSTSGTAYTRQALTGVSATTTGQVTTLTCANPTWPSSTISAKYAVFFDAGTGGSGVTANDAGSNKLLCYWDFGGTNSSSSGSFTLTIAGGGLITWTAS